MRNRCFAQPHWFNDIEYECNLAVSRERKISPKCVWPNRNFSEPPFSMDGVRTDMPVFIDVTAVGSLSSAQKCLFISDFEGLPEVFGHGRPHKWPQDVHKISGLKTFSFGWSLFLSMRWVISRNTERTVSCKLHGLDDVIEILFPEDYASETSKRCWRTEGAWREEINSGELFFAAFFFGPCYPSNPFSEPLICNTNQHLQLIV